MEYMAVRVDTLFDRRVFKAFTRTVGIYPLGTVLRLRSNRLAWCVPSMSPNRCVLA